MTAPVKFSLRQQVEAVRYAESRQAAVKNGGSYRELRPAREAEYDVQRLNAAARTLEWLQQHEDEIRKLLAIAAERRALLWNHMHDVAELLDGLGANPKPPEA